MKRPKPRAPHMPISLVRRRHDINNDQKARDFVTTVWHECAHVLAAAACGITYHDISVSVGESGVSGRSCLDMPTPLQDAFVDFAGYVHDRIHFGDAAFLGSENELRVQGDVDRAFITCQVRLGIGVDFVYAAAEDFVGDHIGLIRAVGRELIPLLIDADTVHGDVVASVLNRHRQRILPFHEYERRWICLDPAAKGRNHWY